MGDEILGLGGGNGEGIDFSKLVGAIEKEAASDDSIELESSASNLNIELTDEFLNVLDAMENGHDNIFLTGDAGTGKSTLVRHFLSTTKKRVVVLAPTGIAAINIGGQTIHSFFRFRPGPINVSKLKFNSYFSRMLGKVDAILIDEISMVRVDMMDAMDASLRLNNGEPNYPFGAIQMIMVGDLAQLPPVVGDPMEQLYINNRYESRYFFHSHAIKESGINKFKLTKIFRQTDANFIKLLNHVKNGSINQKMINWINARCANRNRNDDSVYLCTTNAIVQAMNKQGMDMLDGEIFTYNTHVVGDFSLKGTRFKEKIELKVGAKIMMIKNDPLFRWFNGTMGKVISLSEKRIIVQIDGKQYPVFPETWEKYKYSMGIGGELDKKVVGSITAMPLVPAWAITIHKSQGCTFNAAHINFGSGAFDHGQTYVALSRCTTLDGMTFEQKLNLKDIMFDNVVKEFLRDI